jgi:hypothetical protein
MNKRTTTRVTVAVVTAAGIKADINVYSRKL